MPKDFRLKEDPWAYFLRVPGVKLVPVAKLKTTRARPTGIENAEHHMYSAAYGHGQKRKPISVRQDGDDWVVEDGNSTTAIAKKHGWKHLPVLEVEGLSGH